MPLLQDKLALVTGAGRGLGAVIAQGFHAEGARILVCDIDAEAAASTARGIVAAGGSAWSQHLDVTDRDAVKAFSQKMHAEHGNIDILVNNAGVAGRAALDDPCVEAVWDRIVAVNLEGAFNVALAFIPALKESRGVIINMASVISFVSGASTAGYVVSKGGVRSLTQVLARDLASHGIRVNAVAPGVMATDMAAAQLARPNGVDWFLNRAMIKRVGDPQEIVGPVVFLASSMSSFVTGTVLPVDGGFLAA